MSKIYINDGWGFTENFTEELHAKDCSIPLSEIRVPHTVKETPFNYFDEHIYQMMELTMQSLAEMNKLMRGRREGYDVNRTFNIEHEINNFRNQLKSQNINDVNNHEYTYAVGTIYMDLINECEKLGDYVVNVVEARMGIR
jgi:Na+/phosphate symporter